ncbi:MAG: family 1 glycosylhydrolase [Polyangiaceae bacterium]
MLGSTSKTGLAAATLAILGLSAACGASDANDSGATQPEITSSPPPGSTPALSPDGDGGALPPVKGTFPRGFVFGTAIAGFQVDMGCPTVPGFKCEDRRSDWYQFITTERLVNNPLLFQSKDPPSAGPGFFELYEQDLDRAGGTADGQLGTGALRLSIEWSRVFPNPTFGITDPAALKAAADPAALAYYHRVLAGLKRRGMTPFVTVNHYSLPLWIHDGNACNQSLSKCIEDGRAGWANPNRKIIVDEIAKYAGFVAREFGGEVDQWATLNEPFSAVVMAGYVLSSPMRSNPPGLSGPWMSLSGAKTAAVAMIEAHARMYDAIKANDKVDASGDGKAAEVGLVYAFSDIAPLTDNEGDARAADNAQYFFHDMFMDGVVLGKVDENWDAGRGNTKVRADLANRCDFVGVNYYFRFEAQNTIAPLPFISKFITFNMLRPFDQDAPEGIYAALKRVHERYKLPIIVSEAGRVQDDEQKAAAWFVKSVAETRHAIQDGVDVRGYFAWSLTDNYEWNHGMHMPFGLYGVDTKTKVRTQRESGHVFAEMAKSRDVSASLLQKYADTLKK